MDPADGMVKRELKLLQHKFKAHQQKVRALREILIA
jgi:hypothetical protein